MPVKLGKKAKLYFSARRSLYPFVYVFISKMKTARKGICELHSLSLKYRNLISISGGVRLAGNGVQMVSKQLLSILLGRY